MDEGVSGLVVVGEGKWKTAEGSRIEDSGRPRHLICTNTTDLEDVTNVLCQYRYLSFKRHVLWDLQREWSRGWEKSRNLNDRAAMERYARSTIQVALQLCISRLYFCRQFGPFFQFRFYPAGGDDRTGCVRERRARLRPLRRRRSRLFNLDRRILVLCSLRVSKS